MISVTVPFGISFPLLHMYVTLLSVMIIVSVVVSVTSVSQKTYRYNPLHAYTYTHIHLRGSQCCLDVYIDVISSVIVRVEDIRAHIQICYVFIYIYVHIYIHIYMYI